MDITHQLNEQAHSIRKAKASAEWTAIGVNGLAAYAFAQQRLTSTVI
jgi:uncharacterized protein involved in copper resistance